MKINTALILCAGFGKRLNPITNNIPKPLLKLNDITMLEHCINTILKLKIKKIFLNTFYLEEQIFEFLKKNNFSADITIVKDGEKILNTGGGILNMMNHSLDDNFLIFNPDTIWDLNYLDCIWKMEEFYYDNKIKNILLVVNRKKSFDISLKGDFVLDKNNLRKDITNN